MGRREPYQLSEASLDIAAALDIPPILSLLTQGSQWDAKRAARVSSNCCAFQTAEYIRKETGETHVTPMKTIVERRKLPSSPAKIRMGISLGFTELGCGYIADLVNQRVNELDLSRVDHEDTDAMRYVITNDEFWDLPVRRSTVLLDEGHFILVWQGLKTREEKNRLLSNWDLTDSCGTYLLSTGNYGYFETLLGLKGPDGWRSGANSHFNPFHSAAYKGETARLDWLLTLGLEIATSDYSIYVTNSETALWALKHGVAPGVLMEAALGSLRALDRGIPDLLFGRGIPFSETAPVLLLESGHQHPLKWLEEREISLPSTIADVIAWTSSLTTLKEALAGGFSVSRSFPVTFIHDLFIKRGVYFTPDGAVLEFLLERGIWLDIPLEWIELNMENARAIEKHIRPLNASEGASMLPYAQNKDIVWLADRFSRSSAFIAHLGLCGEKGRLCFILIRYLHGGEAYPPEIRDLVEIYKEGDFR